MPKNTIGDLRDHLFKTLEGLRDKANPLDLDRAHAIADVSRALIESAKVEVDFIRATDGLPSTGFIPDAPPVTPPRLQPPPTEESARLTRIAASPGPIAHVNGEEYEVVWNGGEGLSGVGKQAQR